MGAMSLSLHTHMAAWCTINFITGLPESEGRTNIAVITDKLTKGVIFKGIDSISAEDTV